MTKPQLVRAVAKQTGMKQKDVGAVVEAMLDTIANTVSRKERVSLVGFGSFNVRERGPRAGVNPRTGARIRIPAGKSCVFRPGRRLRDAVERG